MEKPWEIDLTVYSDELELLAGLRRRDPLACTCLLKQYAPQLYRLASRLMPDHAAAEDVLQEGMLQACTRIDTFEGRSSLGSWLHRIVYNAALMQLRRPAPRTVSLHSAAEQAVADASLFDPGPTPDQHSLIDELQSHIDAAVRTLPENLRLALILRDIQGMSTRDAAHALGISESALKVRLHRARQHVRETLKHYVE